MRVSLQSRYGTWLPGSPCTSASTTLPRVVRLELMLFISTSRWPSDSLFFRRSDPARSTMLSLPWTVCPSGSLCVRVRVKMVCEREDTSFIAVDSVCRSAAPALRMAVASSMVVRVCSSTPFTYTLPCSSSNTSKSAAAAEEDLLARRAEEGRLPAPVSWDWQAAPRSRTPSKYSSRKLTWHRASDPGCSARICAARSSIASAARGTTPRRSDCPLSWPKML
mmetsp:Transcript_9726/g.18322  ORF Transcript_9726/g.18322 Transcript_9726/m.18322 type:complete len:222 (+) Transcript_9726:338-1003(+)